MTTTKYMKQGDRLPSLLVSFSYVDASASLSDDLPLGSSVVFIMRPERATDDDTPTIDRASAVLVSSSGGTVVLRYDWASGDTATVGTYRAEFEATVGGKALTLPTSGYIRVEVQDDLG